MASSSRPHTFASVVRAVVLALLRVACVAPAATAADEMGSLRAGFARADITPPVEMLNWTLTPARPYGEVHDSLYVRALVLADGRNRVVLIGWDLLDAREFAVGRVRVAISGATGIPEHNIIVQATHNHSGPKSEMGSEPNTARELRTSRPVQEGPAYRAWAARVVKTCVAVVQNAEAALQPADLFMGRAFVGDWLFNRRPIKADQTVQSMLLPPDPYVLGGGLRFGTVDPTLTVLSLRARTGRSIALLFHVPMHAVAVYSQYAGISADWPGRAADLIRTKAGCEAMFLQGCAGDIVPIRRGFEAVDAMASAISDRAVAADKAAVKLIGGELRVKRAVIGLPATEAAARDLGRKLIDAEVMQVTWGPLALVTLPGEPLLELSTAIQSRSPLPHTLVLGYANGRGIGYVGLPGGKAKGGYEMGEVGTGTDEAGAVLVEAAVRLFQER